MKQEEKKDKVTKETILKIKRIDGVDWKLWESGYVLKAGEKISIHPKLGKVVTIERR